MVKEKAENNLEVLRGFCAAMVILYHCIINSSTFDFGYDIRSSIISYTPNGHLMVLVFFMLSGYVIGISNLGKPYFNFLIYIKARLTRLYPIYLVAILITVILFVQKWRVVLSTLFFMQCLLTPPPEYNGALWSLNHEVLYYILAIPILKYRPNPLIILGILFATVTLSALKLQFPAIIEGYLCGFFFWVAGYTLSTIKIKQREINNIVPDRLLSALFLLLACDFLNSSKILFTSRFILHGISHIPLFDSLVTFDDFGALLFCIYALIIATSTNLKYNKVVTLVVYFLCWSNLFYVIFNGSFFKVNIFYIPAFFLVLSTLFLFWPIKFPFMKRMWLYVGSISYALYVLHMPILYYLGKFQILTGTTISFLVRVLILFATIVPIAHFLERFLQPRLKRLFLNSKI